MDPGFLAKLERDRVEASNRLADRRTATATPAPSQPLVSRTTTESSTIRSNTQQDKGEIETKVIGGAGSDSGDTPLTAADFTEIYVTGNVAAAPAFVYLTAFTDTNTDWQTL